MRSRISARFMAPGDETPRAHQGGTPRAGGRSPRPCGDVCAEPLRLEASLETRGVPSSGAGPSQNGTCLAGGIGSKIRAGRTTACFNLFSVRQDPSLYNANWSTPSENNRFFQVLWGKNRSKQSRKQSYHTLFTIGVLYVRPSFLSCLLRSPNSYLGSHSMPFSPLPTTCYGGGNCPQVDILFSFRFGRKSVGRRGQFLAP